MASRPTASMTPLLRKFLGIHWIFFATMCGLLAFGVLCVYSAVHFREGDLAFLADKWEDQMQWILYGLPVFFAVTLVDYKWVKWGAAPLYLAGLVLMTLLLIRGEEVYGQKIALNLGVRFQPSQVAIMSTIMLVSLVLAEGPKFLPLLRYHFLRLITACLVFIVPFIYILKAKDLGSALVMLPVFAMLLLGGGIPYRYLLAMFLAGACLAPIFYFFGLKDYQKERIDTTYMVLRGQKVNEKDEAYALVNNLIAIGSSGWEGKGYDPAKMAETTKSMTQLGLVSKKTAHDDFIFTVVAETFGFRGSALLIMGFLFMLLMCLTIALFSRDSLGRLLVVGIMGLIFAHCFEHIGMNIGLLPITGIPLPLVSYGGTFIMICMFLLGLAQSVWVHRNIALQEPEAESAPGQRSAPPKR